MNNEPCTNDQITMLLIVNSKDYESISLFVGLVM